MQPDPHLMQQAALAAAGSSARAALRVHVAAEVYAGLCMARYDDSEVMIPDQDLDQLASFALRAGDRFVRAVDAVRT